MPTMEYNASVPDQVANAIQTLTNACSNWPKVPMPDMPVAAKWDDATIAAMRICHVILDADSGMTLLTFGVFLCVTAVFLMWLFCSTSYTLYKVVKNAWLAKRAHS